MKLPSVSARQWHRTAASSSVSGTATIPRYTKTYVIHLSEEYILQHANRLPNDQSEFIQAPQLLLPNYGVGRLRRYNLDIDMMTMFNSEERRLEQWRFHPSDFAMRQAWNLRKIWNIGDMRVPSSLVKGASISSSHCSNNVLSPKTKFGHYWSVSRWTSKHNFSNCLWYTRH